MEIKIKLNVEILKNSLAAFYKKQKIMIYGLSSLIIIIGLMELVLGISEDKMFYLMFGIFCLIFGIFYVIFCTFIFSRNIKLNTEQFIQLNQGEEGNYTYTFNEHDFIERNETNGNTITVPYSMLKNCVETNNVFLLSTSLKQLIYIPKDQTSLEQQNEILELLKKSNVVVKKTK